MAKKMQKTSNNKKQSNAQLSSTVKDSAQQIWLAGLGADARILAVFEPRSNTMKLGAMKSQLPWALENADLAFCHTAGLVERQAQDAGAMLGMQGCHAVVFRLIAIYLIAVGALWTGFKGILATRIQVRSARVSSLSGVISSP